MIKRIAVPRNYRAHESGAGMEIRNKYLVKERRDLSHVRELSSADMSAPYAPTEIICKLCKTYRVGGEQSGSTGDLS